MTGAPDRRRGAKPPFIAPLILALLALGACSTLGLGTPHAATPAERGHAVALRACSACHAVERGGTSPVRRAPTFGSVEMAHVAGLPGRVAEITRAGHYGMPAVKLTPQEVDDLVAWIERR